MARWKLTIEYDGRPFNGWQSQKDKSGIQDYVSKAIKDFSKDCELEAYTSWGEKNHGTKVQFSEGYKRIN